MPKPTYEEVMSVAMKQNARILELTSALASALALAAGQRGTEKEHAALVKVLEGKR